MKQMFAITRKELRGYFGSPMAIIFIGAFLATTLFTFFWVEGFFGRGIADVRPLFKWMPVLMIFLVAALTMRQWSEEQRTGTQEMLLTLPVSTVHLVLGKFLAVVALVVVALALTIFLPISISFLGNLDWGPVFGGYLAAILLAAAYAAIGLFISSRTDNQIVALISTVLICGLLYVVGTSGVTDFFGQGVGDILRAIGAGSRFESIQRGVVDLRDLLYYLTLTGIFLTLNVLSLKAKGWSTGEHTQPQRNGLALTSALLVVNLLVANIWAYPLHSLRVDLTEQKEYSLSPVTRNLLQNLREPLLIRGYFSEKTHPLLAPLVPTVRDMLQEYEIASGGKVQLEIVDPLDDPEKEAEANQFYGINATPFQITGRSETSVVNAYFDVLIRYGDQSKVLNFQDLIEVQSTLDGTDVRLRNLEYDLTSAIKKVVYGFQSAEAVLASLPSPAELTLYVTPATLPEWLQAVPQTVETVANELVAKSNGKFTYTVVDPTAADSPATPQELYEQYGIQPYAISLFSDQTYYFSMLLKVGEEAQVVYPSGELSEANIRTALKSALERFSTGFLQVVGLWTPPATPTQDMYGQTQEPLASWDTIESALAEEYEVRTLDLSSGQIAMDVDVVVVVAPQAMTDKERYAIDQYLMRGGSVIVSAGNYMLTVDQMSGDLALQPLTDGVQPLLSSYGITVEQSLVLDVQNELFPALVNRTTGSYDLVNYPFFVTVLSDGMAEGSPLVSNLSAVTLNWPSPITVDEAKNANRQVTTLLRSSEASWTQADTTIMPDFTLYPESGFPQGETLQSYPLAVAVQGVFESAFKDQPSPLEAEAAEGAEAAPQNVPGTLPSSPATARLVVIGSAEFLDDLIFSISSQVSPGDSYLNSLKLVQNAVAWSTEDTDMLSIRARGTSSRALHQLSSYEGVQSFWEIGNYVLALLALGVLGVIWTVLRKNEHPMELIPPEDKEKVFDEKANTSHKEVQA